ncbi:tetratricopeptide repeat protein [Anaeromicropila herbilytica]|uniref:Tetratricopeptide repeat protein n=1 Tax=Anaeromicropila herbilytica TaxID=2785025 RepID=A0A7R7ICA5_9FIRM|nr:tetratricopeptide repeat protein [Anaeromicropila herbilytica]BCN30528.1 hypothetical protein bsdtb5_18230 [Anaeromicropila herbilytica]
MSTLWKELGIEETKDKNIIKDAYRSKLVTVNPEDDEEGFKALRSAYEEAMRLADLEVEELIERKEDTPISQWLQKVNSTYQDFYKRIKVEEWEELLKEDICIGLETSNEVKEQLLIFLMDNFRLPHKVWIALNRIFHFTEEKEELYERYPKNFIDFIERAVWNEDFLDYDLFDGDSDSDYDGFIQIYYELKNALEEQNPNDIEKYIIECKDFMIYHPYLAVEEARCCIINKDYTKAKEIMEELQREYPDNTYIMYFYAYILYENNHIDEAFHTYQTLLEQVPNHYSAKLGLADCYFKKEDYEKAKEYYIDILENYPQDSYAENGMIKVNEILIQQYQEVIKEDANNINTILELGWCYYQNLHYEECIELLDKLTPDEENKLDYCNLKGRTLLYHNDFLRALEYLPVWLEGLEAITDEDTEELKKKRKRIGYAYFTISSAYSGLAKKEEKYLDIALEYVDKAIDKEDDLIQILSYKNQRADLLYSMNRYEECVDQCDSILEESEEYYPAIVKRQEAYYELERYQNVVDDYYKAIEIYSKDARPYKLAIKTFLLYQKYEDAMDIINKAKEEETYTDDICLLEVRAIRDNASTEEDMDKAYQLLNTVKEHIKEGTSVLERQGEAYYEGAICLRDLKKYKEALEEINQALHLTPDVDDYIYCKANILFDMQEYSQAESIYQLLGEKFINNENIIYKLARICDLRGERNKALQSYEEVLSINPENGNANYCIAEIYEEVAKETGKREYFERALPYRSRQIELYANDYNYIERGLLYAELERYEEAIEDYKKAIEDNPDSPYPYNNIGLAYQYQGKYELAIEYYSQSIDHFEDETIIMPYNNMADCYIILNRLEEAEECYKENLKLFPDRETSYTYLADLYRKRKEYVEAIRFYERAIKNLANINKNKIYLEIAETYEEKRDHKNAILYYKKAIKEDVKAPKAYAAFAGYYLYVGDNYGKAIKMLKKAIQLSEDHDDYFDYWGELGKRPKTQCKQHLICI